MNTAPAYDALEPNYHNLANAVIVKAAEDYLNLIAGFTNRVGHDYDMEKQSLLHFFHSPWYHLLTDVKGDYIISELDRKARSMILRYTVAKDETGRWYVCNVDSKDRPLTKSWKDKSVALHHAAEMQDTDYTMYQKIRIREHQV